MIYKKKLRNQRLSNKLIILKIRQNIKEYNKKVKAWQLLQMNKNRKKVKYSHKSNIIKIKLTGSLKI